ncbi:MAG: hypothetical protein JWP58_2025 [Hymenobacter sp.]|nr:hypothetical protein [Hymenobacter sp.]
MNRFTTGIITVLRYLFLVVSVAGTLALAFYLYRAFFMPTQPGDIITLNVRQRPALDWEAELGQLQTARQQLTAHDSAQLVPRSSSFVLVQHEPNAVRRLALRLINPEPQSVPRVVAALLFCVLVYRILRDLRPGQPFAPANVRRLRWLGILLIGCDVYYWTAQWWLGHYLATAGSAPSGLTPVMDFGSSLVANWLIGLLLLIIATGYQRGVELAEDAEFTV